jgi:hypothetical protein
VDLDGIIESLGFHFSWFFHYAFPTNIFSPVAASIEVLPLQVLFLNL